MVFCIALILQCCTSDYTENLGGGYFFRNEGGDLKDILSKEPKGGEVPSTVIAFDYDKNFIIAKQRPKLPQDILYEKNYNYELGATQSAPELSQDVKALQNDKRFVPNASFIILYRIKSQIEPAEYDYSHEYRP